MGARVARLVGRGLFGLPSGLLRAMLGRPVQVDGRTLDLHMQLLLVLLRAQGQTGLLGVDTSETPEHARRRVRSRVLRMAGTVPTLARVRDLEIPGPAGKLRARHYVPEADPGTPPPLLVFFHGGGFVACDLDTHDEGCRVLSEQAGVQVLSVEYRLAPEHPFPAGVEDACAALRHGLTHAAQLGADPRRVVVGGDSAGGNLATVAARTLAATGLRCAMQLLIYPVVDFAGTHHSRASMGTGFGLSAAEIEWVEGCYPPPGVDRRDPRLSPLRAADLSGQPPALVITAGFDPLRDEGQAYAEALRAAGNEVTHLELPGMIHGFAQMLLSSHARQAWGQVAQQLRACLAAPRVESP